MGKLVVVSLLAVMVTALGISSAVAVEDDYPDFSKVAKDFDREIHLKIGGPGGVNFITSGPEYERVQKVAKKMECPYEVFLVRDNSFNAGASISRIYVNAGAEKKCSDDNYLAVLIGHEETHVSHHHLENQYDKQVADINKINVSIRALNQPGYEENAKMAARIAKPLLKLASLRYSRVDEFDADLGGFQEAKRHGYDTKDALGIFDLMGKGFTGIFSIAATHPPSETRKSRVEANLPKVLAEEARTESVKSNVEKGKVVDAELFAKMVSSKDFTGFAYHQIMKDGPVYIFAEGVGEMPKDGNAVVLPKNAKEVVFLLVNPKPENYVSFCINVLLGKTESVQIFYEKRFDSCRYLAANVPVASLLKGRQIVVSADFGKSPFPPGTEFTADNILKLLALKNRYFNVKQ